MTEIVLVGIWTKVHWQLAYEAEKHAVKGEIITLTYVTPEGDVTLTVKSRGHQITIRRSRAAEGHEI